MDPLIKKEIDKDYTACIAEFMNASIIYKDVLTNKEEITPELKQARIDAVAMYLGRVGEMSYKYLLRLKQVEINPNISYEGFSNGNRIDKIGTIKNFKDRGFMSQDDYDEIENFSSNSGSMKFHDFAYLELIFKKLVKDAYNNFEKLIEYTFDSNVIDKVLDERINSLDKNTNYEDKYLFNDGKDYLSISIFPKILEIGTDNFTLKVEETAKLRMNNLIETAKKNGDLFTRLRYFSNHVNMDDIDSTTLNIIYNYMSLLVEYIKYVHDNNNLYVDTSLIHAKKEALKYSMLLNRSEASINYIFDNYKDLNWIDIEMLLFSGYSVSNTKDDYKELLNLMEEYNIDYDKETLFIKLINNSLRPDVLRKFFENDIFDLDTIDECLYKEDGLRDPKEVEKMINQYKHKIK